MLLYVFPNVVFIFQIERILSGLCSAVLLLVYSPLEANKWLGKQARHTNEIDQCFSAAEADTKNHILICNLTCPHRLCLYKGGN